MSSRETDSSRPHAGPSDECVDGLHDILRLSEVVGYGESLYDSLRAFWRATRTESRDLEKELRRAYLKWLRASQLAHYLCFADITFFEPGNPRHALTLTIGPDGAPHRYWEVLQDYIGAGHSLALHTVYKHGLPLVGDNLRLAGLGERVGDDAILCTDLSGPRRSTAGISGRVRPWPASDNDDEDHTLNRTTLLRETYPDGQVEHQEEIDSTGIACHWQEWVRRFDERRTQFLSEQQEPLRWLISFPVGYRLHSGQAKYELVACVFLGLDTTAVEDDVHRLIRWFLLHLVPTNLLSHARSAGAREREAMLTAAQQHELLRLAQTIGLTTDPTLLKAIMNWLMALYLDFEPHNREHEDFLRQWGDSWTSFFAYCIRTAASVEAVACHRSDATKVHQDLDRIVEMSTVALDDVPEFPAEDERWARLWQFHRAVIAAIRNAIQHTLYSVRSAPSEAQWIRVVSQRVSDIDRRHVLRVVNPTYYRDEDLRRDGFVKGTTVDLENVATKRSHDARERTKGTFAAIRTFVAGYRADPLLVDLFCEAPLTPRPTPARDHVFHWTALLPFPGEG